MTLAKLDGPNSFRNHRMEWALALIVLGSRLAVFAWAGSPLPYFDQWVAEFNNTFLLFIGGESLWSTLLTPHNEHVVLTTKLVSLAGFLLNGYWDVEFLAVCAAFVRAFAASAIFRLLTDSVDASTRRWIWFACLVTFAVPYSGYNVLCGLQICFYFADLAALASIACVLRWSSPAWSGLQLVVCTIAGLLSLGSSVAIPGATLAVHLLTRKRRPLFFPVWGITVGLVALYGVGLHRVRPVGASALPLSERIRFFLELFSWPIGNAFVGALILAVVILLLAVLFRRGQSSQPSLASVAGLGVFAAANGAMIALFRSGDAFHMRHWETIALIPLSFFALIAISTRLIPFGVQTSRWGLNAAAAVFVFFLARAVIAQSGPYIKEAHDRRAEAVVYYRDVLTSQRMVAERIRINDFLAAKDYSFFDDPIARFAPHPTVTSNIMVKPLVAVALLAPEILPVRPPSTTSRVIRRLKNYGWLFGALGLACALSDWRQRGGRARTES